MPNRKASRPDPLTAAQRQLNMSRIRSRDTKPELQLRRALHAAGFRYRVHDRELPGTPDLVLPARNAVVFVHGCFWHGHTCGLGVIPGSRTDFWVDKIEKNRMRDVTNEQALLDAGWRVLTVWECAFRGRGRLPGDQVATRAAAFLRSDEKQLGILGAPPI